MKKIEFFKVEGNRINRIRKHCPKCGPAVFLAEHKNRFSCGKCGYTEFKGGGKREEPTPSKVEEPTKQPSQKQEKTDMAPESSVEEPTEEIPAPTPDVPTDESPVGDQPAEDTPREEPKKDKESEPKETN